MVQVPVGTVIREVSRYDPVAEEEERVRSDAGFMDSTDADTRGRWNRDKWILYPSTTPTDYASAEFPILPRARKSNLAL